MGMSVKFRFSCDMALLVCTRCYWHIGSAAQECIDETAKTQQFIQRTDERRILWR
jgi:hypothetical protein